MKNEDGIWCDVITGTRCNKAASYVHACQVEGAEFAMCSGHEREWKGKTQGKPHQQMRCPRCLPKFIADGGGRLESARQDNMPAPITGPLAEAFNNAMFLEGILEPTRNRVLSRLGGTDDTYVGAIFRSTASDSSRAAS